MIFMRFLKICILMKFDWVFTAQVNQWRNRPCSCLMNLRDWCCVNIKISMMVTNALKGHGT